MRKRKPEPAGLLTNLQTNLQNIFKGFLPQR